MLIIHRKSVYSLVTAGEYTLLHTFAPLLCGEALDKAKPAFDFIMETYTASWGYMKEGFVCALQKA